MEILLPVLLLTCIDNCIHSVRDQQQLAMEGHHLSLVAQHQSLQTTLIALKQCYAFGVTRLCAQPQAYMSHLYGWLELGDNGRSAEEETVVRRTCVYASVI